MTKQTTLVQINKINAQLNYDAIDEDFYLYRVSPMEKDSPEKWRTNEKFCVLDRPTLGLKALATVSGMKFETLMLFPKTDSPNIIEKKLHAEFPDNNFKIDKITGTDLNDPEFRAKHFGFGDRSLVQLLLNSMYNAKEPELRIHNMTGQLYQLFYERDQDKYGHLSFLNFYISGGMILNIRVKTFSRKWKNDSAYKPGPEYVKDFIFRRAIRKEDDHLVHYVPKAQSHFKNDCDFFRFSSNTDFLHKSKLGFLTQILQKAMKNLSKYMTISFVEIPVYTYEINSRAPQAIKKRKAAAIASWLSGKTIYVENELGEEYESDAQNFCNYLKNILPKFLCSGEKDSRVNKPDYNVVYCGADAAPDNEAAFALFHPKKDYEEDIFEDDPYRKIHTRPGVTQGITDDVLSSFTKGKPSIGIVFNLFEQLLIKDDIRNQIVGRYQSETHQKIDSSLYPLHFVIARKILDSKHHYLETIFYRMTLNEDGTFSFDTFKDDPSRYLTDSDSVELKIIDAFNKKTGNGYLQAGETLEGIYYSKPDNLHQIFRTSQFFIPDLFAIDEEFSNLNKYVKKDVVLQKLKDFSKIYPEHLDRICELIDELQQFPTEFPLSTLNRQANSILVSRTIAKKRLANYFAEENIGLLESRWKSVSKFNIFSLTDLHYFYAKRPLLQLHRAVPGVPTKETFCYCSGPSHTYIQSSISKASIIRAVVAEKENNFIKLLPMIDVDFVRSDCGFSVLPFPFKYLHEYAQTELLK